MTRWLRAALIAAVAFDFLTPTAGLFQANAQSFQPAPPPGDDGFPDHHAHVTNLPQLTPGGALGVRPDTGTVWQLAPLPSIPAAGTVMGYMGLVDQFGWNRLQINPDGSLNVEADTISPSGSTAAITFTSTATSCIPAGLRHLLAVKNESAAASIAISFAGTAALNTAGSWTIAPGQVLTFAGPVVPSDTVSCISSGSTPATVMVY